MRALLVVVVGCGPGKGTRTEVPTPAPTGSVETRPPNAEGQTPAFPGQTRAPAVSSSAPFDVTVVATGLEHPWSLAFLDDGWMLVTERAGNLRVVGADGTVSEPIAGVPAVDDRDQGGLLDVVASPSFAEDRRVYLSYAEPREGGNGTTVARGTLDAERTRLDEVEVLFRQLPTMDSTKHFGSRLVFAPDGNLFVTLGERSIVEGRVQAQDLASHLGKVVRIAPDGTVPADNPFVGQDGRKPEIWSFGHRNLQSAALHPSGVLWTVEHGPQGGDEVNAPEAGKNYGWPVITYGEDYGGGPIGDGITALPGMEQPLYYWDPVIAPSGMAFYTGDRLPEWRGNLFVGALAGKHLARLVLDGTRVVGEERLLEDRGSRIRDVRQGPDGDLWVLTDEDRGELLRISPSAP